MVRGLFSAYTQVGQHKLRADAGFATGSGYTYSVIGDMDLSAATFLNSGLEWQWKGLRARAWWYALRTDFDLNMDLYHPSTGIELARIPPFSLAGDTAQLEVEYEHSFWDERLLLMAGADGRGTWYRSSQLVDPRVEEYRLGVFLHGELQPLEWLRLTLGGRFDYNTVTPPAFSPRGALVFDLGSGQTLRLSAGTAFRKPTLLETSSNFRIEADPAFADEMRYLFEEKGISNPALDNEELTGFELGWRGDFLDRRLRATFDVYFNMNRKWVNFVNDIRFRPPPFQMQIDLQNSRIGYENSGADYNLLGVHGSLQFEPSDDLSLFVRGEWRHEWRISGDGAEVQAAPWQVAAGGTWKLPFESVLDIAVAHVAARKDYVVDPKSALLPVIWTALPPVTILMASWRYELNLSAGRLELGISVFNPFGGRFREKAGVVDARGANFGGELLGRSVMLTARWKAD
ncbi:MAG: TonB-dependent receptor [Deltaproteobacteria bacterium]|nr:MAG: TonB-dependent receptor [Deltaproteobacteria bacterium]